MNKKNIATYRIGGILLKLRDNESISRVRDAGHGQRPSIKMSQKHILMVRAAVREKEYCEGSYPIKDRP